MKRLLRTFLFVSLGIAVAGVGHSGAALNPGDIVVSDFSAAGGTGAIFTVDPGLGTQTLLSSNQFFSNPWGVAVDASGRIFVTDISAAAVIEVDNMTGAQAVVHGGVPLVQPIGVAVGVGDILWVADVGAAAVFTVNKNTGLTMLVSSGGMLVKPIDIALNKFGTVYVVDWGAGTAGTGAVIEIGGGGAQTLISEGQNFRRPYGIAIDQGAPFFPPNEPGGIYVTDIFADNAIFVDVNGLATTNQTVLSVGQNFSFPGGISLGAWPAFPTPFYVADYGSDAIVEFDPTGDPAANQTVISAGGLFVNPVRLAVVPEQPVQNEETTWGSIKGQYR